MGRKEIKHTPTLQQIFYGLLLGLGAWFIDVVMHARIEDRGFWEELFRFEAKTFFYRLMFVAFGLLIGWSLWQKSKREREFRRLADVLARFHREIVDPAFLIYAKCELLLGRDDFRLSTEAREVIRFIHEKAYGIESLAKERLSILGEVA